MTKGCTLGAGRFSLPAMTAIIGFGGLCVHCQIFSFLHLRYRHFFVSRVLNGALSALICEGLLFIFPVDVTTALQDGKLMLMPFSVSAPAFFALILMCIVMIFDIDSKKKVW